MLNTRQTDRSPRTATFVRGSLHGTLSHCALWAFDGQGGVLLNAVLGDVFAVDSTDVEKVQRLLSDRVATTEMLELPLWAACDRQNGPVPPSTPDHGRPTPFEIDVSGACHFRVGGVEWFACSPDGEIRMSRAATALPKRQLEKALLSLAPRVARQRGGILTHAAAVMSSDLVVMAAGPSGAGKTTFASALETCGARLVSEDFCILRTNDAFLVPVEEAFRQWTQEVLPDLLRGASVEAPIADGDRLRAVGPVALFLTLSSQRRTGSEVQTRALSGPEALGSLIQHAFPPARPAERLAFFEAVGRILEATAFGVFEATTPLGLPSLTEGIGHFWSSVQPTG